jgi:hypothetical protein
VSVLELGLESSSTKKNGIGYKLGLKKRPFSTLLEEWPDNSTQYILEH